MLGERRRMFSRRGLLRVLMGSTALAAAGPLLQACAGSAPAAPTPQVITKEVERVVTQVVERTVDRVVEKPVDRVVEKVITATAAPQVKAPIKLTISTDWNVGIRRKTMEFWAAEFKKEHPNVTVEVWHIGSGGMTQANYDPTIQTMLLTGTGPTVITEMWWRPKEVYANWDSYLKGKNFKKEDYWWSEYAHEVDGSIYSIPFGAYFSGASVNLDLFEKAGAKLPPKDWGFDELIKLARQLKTTDVWGYERTTGPYGGWADRLASEGAEFYNRQTLKSAIQVGRDGGDPVKMFADWWGLVWKEGIAPKPAETAALLQVARSAGATGGLASSLVWVSGKIAMSWFPFNQAGVVKELVGGRFRYQALWPPKSPYSGRRGYYTNFSYISVNKDVGARGHEAEAFDLGYFWIDDKMGKFQAENIPVVPPHRKWWNSPEFLKAAPGMESFSEMAAEALKTGLDSSKYLSGTGSSPLGFEWYQAVAKKIEDRALIGGEDPVATFAAAVAEGDKVLAKKI
ncbi:MAG: extracellular solute-binding protein [Chloroflexota bacterium]|nr:MAG: extracellular solute-binding protein [Chloroflexota bacterium]